MKSSAEAAAERKDWMSGLDHSLLGEDVDLRLWDRLSISEEAWPGYPLSMWQLLGGGEAPREDVKSGGSLTRRALSPADPPGQTCLER